MMRTLFPFIVSLAIACGGGGADSADKVTQAATIAKQLRAQPDRAETILKDNGMTEAQWEALMFEIAEDPKQSERYEQALAK